MAKTNLVPPHRLSVQKRRKRDKSVKWPVAWDRRVWTDRAQGATDSRVARLR